MNPRVLIIGVGSIGERHLRCFAATGRAQLSICEVNSELRERIARRYDVESVYPDLDAALEDPPDAAVIATPAHLHVPMARRLVAADVHLLIEKPLSTTFEGVASLQKEVAQRKRHVSVAYVYRQHPALQAMRAAIAEGRFGRPVQLVAVCGQHFPTYRPAYRDIYYANRQTGGGAIQDALTHILNAGQWLIGPVRRLVADCDHCVLPGVDVEDTVHLLARHDSVMASYSLNQHQAPNEVVISVHCEQGTCRFEGHRHRWMWMTQPDTPWQSESFDTLQRDDLFVRQAHAFLDQLEQGAPPACTLEEASHTLRVALAALESSEGRRWKEISP